jgi:leader peptidase (prepilin peptidase)/N-methyltransferase
MFARSLDKIAPAFVGRSMRARLGLGLLAVVVIAVSFAFAPGAPGAFGAGLGLIMLAIATVDARRFIIPNELVAAALVLGLVQAAMQESGAAIPALALAALRAAVLVLLFLALRWLYAWWRGREGLGLGDVKLAAAAGVWLDWPSIPLAIEIAAVAALAVYATAHVAGRRRIRAATRLPFGLFLAPAIWLAWLVQSWLDTL